MNSFPGGNAKTDVMRRKSFQNNYNGFFRNISLAKKKPFDDLQKDLLLK
jgi:hypothetical protein